MRTNVLKSIFKLILKFRKSVLKKQDYHLQYLIDEDSDTMYFDDSDVSCKTNNFKVESFVLYDLVDRDDLRKNSAKITKFFYDNRPRKAPYFQDIDRIEEHIDSLASGSISDYCLLGNVEINSKIQ